MKEIIKRQKIHSFAKEDADFKLNNENKIIEVKIERKLFGNILFPALQQKIDMDKITISLSLTNIDE